ncbi:MAG: 50S ribosomal protein L4 [Deltaproteobacteria bacterium]|nr:50S ribosomal protein L4 [Deltaproteobacteria bacterium]
MKMEIFNLNLEVVGEVELASSIFEAEVRPHLVHEVIRAQLNKKRSGSAQTKTRAEVSFSTRKPYRQKKTGRARAGSRKSPLFRKGGTVFGPHPRDYGFTPPASVRRAALKSVLASKLVMKKLTILDAFPLSEIKTRNVVEALHPWNFRSALIVIPEEDRVLEKSAKNIPYIKVLRAQGLNCYDLMCFETLILQKDCLPILEERLLK